MHVAIVMDGNGRWAVRQGLPRTAGHRAGARAIRAVVEAAPRFGIDTLTLYAFSADNWQRPGPEVAALMELFSRYFRDEEARCRAHGIRLDVIGRRDRLPTHLVEAIDAAQRGTADGRALTVRIALDYSGRDAIRRAALRLAAEGRAGCSDQEFADALGLVDGVTGRTEPVDLFIRTGGEQRMSDFLLWESAYAELVFRPEMWPEFGATELAESVAEFRRRERRFGAVGAVREEPRPMLKVIS